MSERLLAFILLAGMAFAVGGALYIRAHYRRTEKKAIQTYVGVVLVYVADNEWASNNFIEQDRPPTSQEMLDGLYHQEEMLVKQAVGIEDEIRHIDKQQPPGFDAVVSNMLQEFLQACLVKDRSRYKKILHTLTTMLRGTSDFLKESNYPKALRSKYTLWTTELFLWTQVVEGWTEYFRHTLRQTK